MLTRMNEEEKTSLQQSTSGQQVVSLNLLRQLAPWISTLIHTHHHDIELVKMTAEAQNKNDGNEMNQIFHIV